MKIVSMYYAILQNSQVLGLHCSVIISFGFALLCLNYIKKCYRKQSYRFRAPTTRNKWCIWCL